METFQTFETASLPPVPMAYWAKPLLKANSSKKNRISKTISAV